MVTLSVAAALVTVLASAPMPESVAEELVIGRGGAHDGSGARDRLGGGG